MVQKQWVRVVIGLAAALATAASIAFADNPQCKSCGDSVDNSGSLVVSYDISGLGGTSVAHWTLSATLDGHARCKNQGGNCPEAANKFGPVNVGSQGTFSVHNGRARGSISLAAAIGLRCPGNQSPQLLDVDWTDITLTVEGSPVFSDDIVSRTFFTCQ